MEALASGGEEISVGVFQRQVAGNIGVRRNVAIAQLGQNHFQRPAKAIQHANAILQRNEFFASL